MEKLIILLFLSSLIFLTGCSKYWYQEGKSFDECKQARGECRSELLKRSDFKNLTVQYEVKFIETCMTEKGYRSFSQGDLPLEAKREEPETSLHWRTHGVAGTLKEQ